jgi:hypothetical protein
MQQIWHAVSILSARVLVIDVAKLSSRRKCKDLFMKVGDHVEPRTRLPCVSGLSQALLALFLLLLYTSRQTKEQC